MSSRGGILSLADFVGGELVVERLESLALLEFDFFDAFSFEAFSSFLLSLLLVFSDFGFDDESCFVLLSAFFLPFLSELPLVSGGVSELDLDVGFSDFCFGFLNLGKEFPPPLNYVNQKDVKLQQ